MRRIGVVFVCLAMMLGLGSAGGAQQGDLSGSLQRARQAEKAGDFRSAAHSYYGMMHGMVQGNPALAAAVGRREIACLTIQAKAELARHPDPEGCESVHMLVDAYKGMQKIEPTNPTWPYLLGCLYCGWGRYVEAKDSFHQSMRCGGGEASVRGKAQTMLAHIDPYAAKDKAHMIAEDKAALWAMQHPAHSSGPHIPLSQYNSGSGVNGIQAWNEGVAKQNAWNAGDMGALGRMNGGGGGVTDADKAHYGGGW